MAAVGLANGQQLQSTEAEAAAAAAAGGGCGSSRRPAASGGHSTLYAHTSAALPLAPSSNSVSGATCPSPRRKGFAEVRASAKRPAAADAPS
jgi:hypothetical protein